MEVVNGSITLVILGAWNPAILTPEWITRELFEIPSETEVNVSLEVPIGSMLSSPRITYEGFVFLTSIDKLTITVLDPTEENLRRAERMARSALTKLSFTPTVAFGQNIAFTDNSPTSQQLVAFESTPPQPPGLETVTSIGTSIRWVIQRDEHLLNVSHELANGQLGLKFNFHYVVSSATEAAEKMENTFFENIEFARSSVSW